VFIESNDDCNAYLRNVRRNDGFKYMYYWPDCQVREIGGERERDGFQDSKSPCACNTCFAFE